MRSSASISGSCAGRSTITRRRGTRRRRRDERRQRSPEEIEAARAQQEAEEADSEGDGTEPPVDGISWLGIVGGLLGMVPLGLLGVGVMLDPGDASRVWAPVFWLAASGFAPAIWLSIRPSEYRRPVQRATVVGCMVGAFIGSFVIITMPMVLLPAASLLAIASGLIFQRS